MTLEISKRASSESVAPATIRRKIESWLAEPDSRMAIALRTRPVWNDEPVLTINGVSVRIVGCPTPLAARAALHDRSEGERLVLLTDLADGELGDGLLAHLSRSQVRSVDHWDIVRQMFQINNLEPAITDPRYGGGRWIADALAEHAPTKGWPRPPVAILTRDYVLTSLSAQLLGLDRDRLDSAGLLQWSTNAGDLMWFTNLPADLKKGITDYLHDIAGPAAAPILSAVHAGHGVEAIPLGLLAAALWPNVPDSTVGTPIAVARTRLEPYFGGARLSDRQAHALRDAAEAWVYRALDSGDFLPEEVQRVLGRAEKLAEKIDATDLLAASDLLPTGFRLRLRTFAAAVVRAIATDAKPPAAAVAAAQRALLAVEQHRHREDHRVDTAQMAVRLLRWLTIDEPAAPRTLLEAVNRQVRDDGWVDRARLDVFAGDTDPLVAEAYRLLHRAVDERRSRHDRQFAALLAADTAAEAPPGALLRVEDVLDRVVAPVLEQHRVLLLVLDGMSVAAATELAESLTRSGSWLELTPGGGPRTGVLAALPTVTEVSRCSLFSGRIAVGQAPEERAAFAQRFPKGKLLHKGGLRAGAGMALDPDVLAALDDPAVRLVAAVVNTIDDALDRSDPGTIVWSKDNIVAVRDLLAQAKDYVVLLISDHGHIVDRGPDSRTAASTSNENRWRPAGRPAGDGEIAVHGSRVAKGGGSVVLPWREDLRYGPRKAGYHGGAAPAEAVIPLIMLSADDDKAVPGWDAAPVASPDWWRETLPDTPPTAIRPDAGRKRGLPRVEQGPSLFEVADVAPATPQTPVAARPALVDALLSSEIYGARQKATRARLTDERVAALLAVLLEGGGRATLDTMAAHAGVPAHRIGGTVTALRKLLQIEGYPVLELDPDGQTVKLDETLLIEQFDLGQQ